MSQKDQYPAGYEPVTSSSWGTCYTALLQKNVVTLSQIYFGTANNIIKAKIVLTFNVLELPFIFKLALLLPTSMSILNLTTLIATSD